MKTFYVVDSVIFPNPASAASDPTDYLTRSARGYSVASSSLTIKRNLTVFDQYEPAADYFDRRSNPLKDGMLRLWKVLAWTQKGAAKNCMRMKGVVFQLAQKDEMKNHAKHELIGKLLLHETGRTDLTHADISDLYKELKEAIPDRT